MRSGVAGKMQQRTRRVAQRLYRMANFSLYKAKCQFKGLYIDYMVLVVGQACSYKCVDCANFCPEAPVEYKRYSLDSIIESLIILLKYVRVEKLQIQGGEPFVYSELGELLQFIAKNKTRIQHVEIATNGSIVPTDALMKIIKDCNATIRISNYGRSLDAVERLKEKCEKYGVKYSIYSFASGMVKWFQCGRSDIGRQTDKSVKKFKECLFNRCLTLERGELSHCSRATNSFRIQGYERKENDYVKIEDSKDFKTKLRKYVLSPMPMEACNYCYGTSTRRMIPAARQLGE